MNLFRLCNVSHSEEMKRNYRHRVDDSGAPLTLGVEEEFHLVDPGSRRLVPAAPALLDRLPASSYAAEFQQSVVETNTQVCADLDGLRHELVRLRRNLVAAADSVGVGVVAAGTAPLADPDELQITNTPRFAAMVDQYQLLGQEQLICGAQVHVGIPDRDVAVAVAQRVAPALPALLALSASSPFWFGRDSGYASLRTLVWSRWPTAGASGPVGSAAEYDALVADLIESGAIADAKMVYFDVRPSAHVPTVELRICDACPVIDDVVLIAGLFRALVRREYAAVLTGAEPVVTAPPLYRAAVWRAARFGLSETLVDLAGTGRPVPAPDLVRGMVTGLRPELEWGGDWEQVNALTEATLSRGTGADRQRRVYARRGRLTDVVDGLLAETRGQVPEVGTGAVSYGVAGAQRVDLAAIDRDEAFGGFAATRPPLPHLIDVLDRLGLDRMRARELARDDAQRTHSVTFRPTGDDEARLFPVDLLPRVIWPQEWRQLSVGLIQRTRVLNAFLQDVYGECAAIRDGLVPDWVVQQSPGFREAGKLVPVDGIRAHLAGGDLVRDADGRWLVLEDNVRVPSGLGYAVQTRRLVEQVVPELTEVTGLLSVDRVGRLLHSTLAAAAPPGCGGDPTVVLLSSGSEDSAWFEHRLLAAEMGVRLVLPADLVVVDQELRLAADGSRIDVVYRRVDDDLLPDAVAADGGPLGPSLLDAVGSGAVTLANAVGNGVADDKALYAFIRPLTEFYLGEAPLLDDVPTYLCGDPDQLCHVLDRLGDLVLKPVDGYGGRGVLIGPDATDAEIDEVRRAVVAEPNKWVAQEPVALSTHPVLTEDGLSPRHVDLRAFVLSGDAVVVAPAALTRVAPAGSRIVNSSRGGGAKDTWLLG